MNLRSAASVGITSGHQLAGTCLILCLPLITGCRTMSHPDSAPALGTLGGAAAGAIIGSSTGSAGSGAFIGSLIGHSGGELVRIGNYEARYAAASVRPENVKPMLAAADRLNTALSKEHTALARQRAVSPQTGTEPARAAARRRLPEIDGWIRHLKSADAAHSRAISDSTAVPDRHLGTLLNQRAQIRERLGTLEIHRSCFKTLAS
jgi:Glycine zipper